MENERISARRLRGAAWAAILAPGVSVLPGLCARQAGMGGWLSILVALPAVLLLGRVLARLSRGGLARAFFSLLGPVWGRLLTIIYIMWALALGAARLRLSGQRMMFTARQETGVWFFLVVLVTACVWLVWRGTAVFGRATAVFYRILILALVVVLVLTASQIRIEHLWPLWKEDVLTVFRGAVSALGVLCYGVYAAFLCDGAEEDGVWAGDAVWMCGLLALLQTAVLGNLGSELIGGLADPFLTLSKHVGVEGAFQRVESLVGALWLFADLTLIGLLLTACRCMAEQAVPQWNGVWVVSVCAAIVLLGSGLVFRDAVLAQRFEYKVAPLGNLVLGAVLPGTLFLLDRKNGGGTSCASAGGENADVAPGKTTRKNF